ncbi:MAG: prepilin-type N-terminal cleavage/methylation domain-containing protein [Saccharofermentans sp.]|nr:prepilin-type N-terminal cleavage/methylation domain-containing protein [Saccharofermentans sp.]
MKKIVKVTSKKGFTLVEMMLVVAIIVILASVAFVSIGTVLQDSGKKQNKYKDSYIPAIDQKASSVQKIMQSSRAPKTP